MLDENHKLRNIVDDIERWSSSIKDIRKIMMKNPDSYDILSEEEQLLNNKIINSSYLFYDL